MFFKQNDRYGETQINYGKESKFTLLFVGNPRAVIE